MRAVSAEARRAFDDCFIRTLPSWGDGLVSEEPPLLHRSPYNKQDCADGEQARPERIERQSPRDDHLCKTSSATNNAVTFAVPSYSPRSAFRQLNVIVAGGQRRAAPWAPTGGAMLRATARVTESPVRQVTAPPREAAHAFTGIWIACQARSVSETLHAWATQPSGRNGASPSKISAIEPMQPSSR